ncbi:MAG: putative molybdenum carrier protein [Immundisolibacteraceae bacterium]|nr:putative molybdenum carrier protein [Immundisolibacteraceae bacterium]
MVKKIVSGGQAGVDRGALDAALQFGFDCGGWCPLGRRAEDGPIDPRYPLTESDSPRYDVRTEQNIIDSDGTLIITGGRLEGGTRLTLELALQKNRPCRVIDLRQPLELEQVIDWLVALEISTLNIAGPRESKQPGIADKTREIVENLLKLIKS